MTTEKLTSFVTILTFVLGLAAAASAATVDEPELETKTSGDITYMSGGVGEEEEAAIESLGQDFNLKVTLADKGSAWLSNVDIEIKDMDGNTLFTQKVEGPLLYMKMPHGKYRVTARSEAGDTHTNTVWIDDQRQARSYFFLGADEGIEPGTKQAAIDE